jgi:trk system potassium uptake protein TrkH
MHRLAPILHILGLIVMVFGASMLLPLTVSLVQGDDAQRAYDEALVITLVSGMLLWLVSRRHYREMRSRDGFLLVVLVWSILPLYASLPLMFYLPGLSFTDAYFEAMSGLTTTGSTVLAGLDDLPKSINLWRTQLHWLGGMGVIVLAVAILPLLGVGGRHMFRAEVPTPMKDTKLTPRMTETAKGLWLVYLLLTAACGIAYHLAGMEGLDALIHAFSTMALGGFSSHDASLAYYDSVALEVITMVFACLAAMNFASHFLFLRSRSFRVYLNDAEIRVFLSVVLASCLGLALYLWAKDIYLDFPSALRYAAFNTISLATSLGYVNDDYNAWPYFAALWMLFLCSFAACSGSTGGGIKMMRAKLLYKQLHRELVKLLHPSAQLPTKLGEHVVPNKIIYAVLAYFFVYVASIVTFTLALAASGLDVFTSFTAVVATINNTGPGLGQVGPASNYAVLNDFQTWICTLAMLMGRLELFTLLVVLTPAFWRK